MKERLRAALPALIGVVLLIAALTVLHRELRSVTWQGLTTDLAQIPPWRILVAVLLTTLNCVVFTGYDFLSFAYLGKHLPWRRVAMTSFVAYAISNNVGFAMLSGTSVRYRFYTRWGITAEDLSRLIFANVITFWLGLLLMGGLSLARSPAIFGPGAMPAVVRPIGWLLMLVSIGYIVASALRLRPIRIRQLELPLPSARIAIAQLAISVLDWALAAAVLHVLLPSGGVPFLAVLGAFVASQLLGLASHIPGGIGVFEGLMVLLLSPFVPSATLLPVLIVYRLVFYLLPLLAAVMVMVTDELQQRRAQAARVGAALGWLTEQLTPRVLAVLTFIAGVILLLSGATPAAHGRLAFLNRILPLGLIELSHFAGSVVGAGLLLLSQALARRLDAAFVLTVIALLTGIEASLFKGADYEEALILTVILLILARARPAFDRRAALFDTRFTARWIVAIVAAMSASIWLGFFAFKHVDYSSQLWWQFELHGEASRMLRATVGAGVALLLFAIARLFTYVPHEATLPTEADLTDAEAIIATQTSTFPNLVFLRDKSILFDDERLAFLMYGVQGRTWAALGDPVGPPERHPALIRRFLERCDDFGGVPVFYEASRDHLAAYADVGLTCVKLGEEARVDLTTFTLEGGHARRYRQAVSRLDKEQATFRVIPAEGVPAFLDQLRSVSDDWLAHRAGAEKGFSLGFFDSTYVTRFPVAIIEQAGRVVAFATLWLGPQHVELGVDLMRYGRTAPREIMETLFVKLMLWGKEQGYRWMPLGMAPLSGFEPSAVASLSLWNRLAAFLYEHGKAVYNFQGLRAFKDKFDPVWEPHYLAYPGGLRLVRVLADVSALIAGGYRRILIK